MTREMHQALMERNLATTRLRAVMHEVERHNQVKRRNGGPDDHDTELYERARQVIRGLPAVTA